MKQLLKTIAVIGFAALSGCSLFRTYHQQIQQGNIITPKMIAQLKPGMTREQVKYVLGTQDVNDPWNSNAWYYTYSNKEDGLPLVKNRLAITFKDNKLSEISGTYPPPDNLQYKTYRTD